jgi:UDP-glucose 4-epimerase
MKVLVTGAAGFIGSWIVDSLLGEGHTVVGVDSLIGGYWDNVAQGKEQYQFSQTDVLALKHLTRVMQGCDVVYHCAALAYEGLSVFSPFLITENIVGGSTAVITAAAVTGVRRVVNCSSMARYGACPTPYEETMDCCPLDPYGLAKWAAEQQLDLVGEIHGVEVVHTVPHNVVGPRQKYDDPYRNVLSIMVNRILQGKPPVVYGDGMQVRCFSFIQDVLPTLLLLGDLSTRVDHGEVFNIGPDGQGITIKELAAEVSRQLDFPGDPIFLPGRPCEVRVALCSSDKIRKRFGFKQTIELEEGISQVIDYIKARGPLPFNYHLPLEIVTPAVPETWKEQSL